MEDNKIIIDEVKRNGDSIATWKSLALKLNRDPEGWTSIRRRYKSIILRPERKTGKWTIEENKE
jgi:hypothetical protein